MNPTREPKRVCIYILDDDHVPREELRNLFELAGYDAIFFADKIALLQGMREELPACICLRQTPVTNLDPILVDLASYRVPMVVITGQGDIPTAVRMIKAGAIDFISGQIESREIVRRLVTALAEIREEANARAYASNQQFSDKPALSPREKEILEHVANGLSSKQIGALLGISWRTVDDHRRRMLQKFGARNTADLMISTMNSNPKSHS